MAYHYVISRKRVGIMEKYATNYQINGEMLSLVASIMEKVGVLSDSESLSQIKAMSKKGQKVLKIKDPFNQADYFAEAKLVDPKVKEMSPMLKKLFSWAKNSNSSTNPLLLAPVFTYMLSVLGPLKTGNEELALVYGKVILAQHRKIFGFLPYEKTLIQKKSEMKKAIVVSGEKGDCGPYIVFFLQALSSSLDQAKSALRSETGEMGPCEKKLISKMKKNVSYSSKELMKQLGLKSRVAVKRNYLEPAMKDNLIKMTIPTKPNSPLQRYIIKNK